MQESRPLGIEHGVSAAPPVTTEEGLDYVGQTIAGTDPITPPETVASQNYIVDTRFSEARRATPRHAKNPDKRQYRLRRAGVILGLVAATLGLTGSPEPSDADTHADISASVEEDFTVTPNLTLEEQEQRDIQAAAQKHAQEEAFEEAFNASSKDEQRIIRQAIAERQRIIEAGPPARTSEYYNGMVGKFIGALIIEPAPYDATVQLSASETKNCDAGMMLESSKMGACFVHQRNGYYNRRNQEVPAPNAISVHRLTDADDYLLASRYTANGGVKMTDNDPGMEVTEYHDVTNITDAPVYYNGVVYDQIEMGKFNYTGPGTILKEVFPSPIAGYVQVDRYELVSTVIVDVSDPNTAEKYLYAPAEGIDYRTSMCWPMDSSTMRKIDSYRRVSSTYEPGSVALVGTMLETEPHVG